MPTLLSFTLGLVELADFGPFNCLTTHGSGPGPSVDSD